MKKIKLENYKLNTRRRKYENLTEYINSVIEFLNEEINENKE